MDIMQYEEDVKNRNCMHKNVDWQDDERGIVRGGYCEDCGVDMGKDARDNDYYLYLLSQGMTEDY